MADEEENIITDQDRDSLHTLALSILPLENRTLKRARLIKNSRLESVIEFFSDGETGSGQLKVEDLINEFGWNPHKPPQDLLIMRKLGALSSYDVFSLRLSLRQLGIKVDDQEHLKLSPTMNQQLASYMKDFTRPLILQMYGDEDMSLQDFDDVLRLFRDPNIQEARKKLKVMADKLQIQMDEIPVFMEDYGDIFLSLSYYRRCLDDLEPKITGFLESIGDLRDNFHYKNDANLMQTINLLESTINERMAAITGRFENFERGTKHMWDNISAARFRKVEQLIKSYHTTIGGVLCALTVKMDAWIKLFPNRTAGGPGRRAEFILSEMKQGLDNIQEIEDSAPMLSGLD